MIRLKGDEMPDAKAIHEVLGILLQHTTEKHPYAAAEHDVFYLPGPPPSELPKDVLAKVEKLGAHWDEAVGSWACFT